MGLCHRADGHGNLSYAGSARGCASAGDEFEVGRGSGRSTSTKFDRRGAEPLAEDEVLLALSCRGHHPAWFVMNLWDHR